MRGGKGVARCVRWRCHFSNSATETRPIPESRGFPIVGTMPSIVAAGGAAKLHLYIDKRHKQYGSIFREKLGPVTGIFISNGNYMRKIFAAEGKYPKHIIPEAWAAYNHIYGYKRGLLFMDGEEWATTRKKLNSVMLKEFEVDFIKASCIVVKGLIERWHGEEEITFLEEQLYNWSLEVIVAILMGSEIFEKHQRDVAQDIRILASTMHRVFVESASLSLIPVQIAVKLKLPVWKRFITAVKSAAEAGEKLLKLITDITKGHPSNRRGLLLKIINTDIKAEDINRIVTDLILAAGDTTSFTMQWLLHLLSINPNIQDIMYAQSQNITEEEAIMNPLFKGALKESLRLYPVAPFITRYIPEDCIIDGYQIKAGELVLMSLYSSGRDEKYFPNPNLFLPQRWRRNSSGYENVVNPNASLPFAIGSRSCVGKKIAETQILVTLWNILRNFHLTTDHKKAIDIKLHLISVPEKPIKLILKSRCK